MILNISTLNTDDQMLFSIWAQNEAMLAPRKGANKLNVATKHSFIIDETLNHLPQKIVRLMVDTAKKLIQDDTRNIIFFFA